MRTVDPVIAEANVCSKEEDEEQPEEIKEEER